MQTNILLLCPLLLLFDAGCVTDDHVSNQQRSIIGGERTSDYAAVVEIEAGGHFSSGVVVSDRVVLTVAHSVAAVIGSPELTEGNVYFGAETTGGNATPDKVLGIQDARIHRYYGIDDTHFYDIGLILLEEDAGVTPIPVNERDLQELVEPGDVVEVVGFGYSNTRETGAGIKRVAEIPIDVISPHYIEYDYAQETTCDGDSGGPHLINVAGQPRVVALSALMTCTGGIRATRVDTYFDQFLAPTIDRWIGNCRLDGTCVERNCRTPDPDCDPCGFNDVCAEDCSTRDLDCPLEGLVGDECEQHSECESGICAAAIDDPRIRYCAYPCLPWLEDAICGNEMSCRPLDDLPSGEEHVCVYEPPTPSAQGATCMANTDCRSEICHAELGICVEPCESTNACSANFQCVGYEGDRVCAVRNDSGCRASIPASPAALILIAGWLFLYRARRRRHTGASESYRVQPVRD